MDNLGSSEEVLNFLSEHIETYEKLEVLLLLDSHRDDRFTCEAVAARLHIDTSSAEEALDGLCASRLVLRRIEGEAPLFQYHPESASSEETVRQLVGAYRDRPLEIIRRMNANALERIRTAALQTFADAFLLKGSKKDG